MQKRGDTIPTINNRIKAMRSFYNFLADNHLSTKDILVDVILKVKQYKEAKTIPNSFTAEEIAGIVKDAMSFGLMHPIKTRALIWFLFYSGLRKKEFLMLKRINFNLSECEFTAKFTKNKIERIGYIPKEVRDMVQEYFSIEPEENNAFNMNRYTFEYFFTKLNECLPKGKHIHPHAMRHSFAMMLVDSSVDVAHAQKMMGHESIDATMRYFRVRDKQVKEIYAKKVKFNGKIK